MTENTQGLFRNEMSSLIASWPKWPICFYLLVSRDSGVNGITASESSVGAGILPQTKRWDFQLMFQSSGALGFKYGYEVLFVSLCLFSAVCTEGLSSPQPPFVQAVSKRCQIFNVFMQVSFGSFLKGSLRVFHVHVSERTDTLIKNAEYFHNMV